MTNRMRDVIEAQVFVLRGQSLIRTSTIPSVPSRRCGRFVTVGGLTRSAVGWAWA
jgi:hypothetical protein